jgi:serine/threonine protein kinase
MKKAKKNIKSSFKDIQQRSLDEGSLDQESFVSGSDLELDTTEDSNRTQEIDLVEDHGNIDIDLEHGQEELSKKPKDKYKFIRSIGFGGMKAVLAVSDKDTTRNVAMAIIPDFEDRPQADINRFIREARITARLEHPNIVPIHDIGIDGSGSPYFTMKFLRGKTLATILKKLKEGDEETLERYDLPQLLRIFVKVCNGISFAHSQHIIHLDLKPENIHVGDFGEVLVLDWGLAKFIGEAENIQVDEKKDEVQNNAVTAMMTLDGVAKGTPGFMAPEQAAGKNREKDERTDIYALGSILYTILTFDSPLSGKGVKEVLEDTIRGNIQAPREMQNPYRTIPAALEAICMKAMERIPDYRYQNVWELREDIFAFMSGFATKAENAGSIKKTFLFINRNWLAMLFIIVLVLLVAVCGSIIFLYSNDVITVNI